MYLKHAKIVVLEISLPPERGLLEGKSTKMENVMQEPTPALAEQRRKQRS